MGNSGGKTTKKEEIEVGEEVQALDVSKEENSKEKMLRFSMPLEVDLDADTNTNPHSNVYQYVSSTNSVKTLKGGISTMQKDVSIVQKTTIGRVQNSPQRASPRAIYRKQEDKIYVSGIRGRASVGRIAKKTSMQLNSRSVSKSPARAISASRTNIKSPPINKALQTARKSIEKSVASQKSPNNRGVKRSMSKSPTRALSAMKKTTPSPLKKVQTSSRSPNKIKSVSTTPKTKLLISKSPRASITRGTSKSKSTIRASVSTRVASSTNERKSSPAKSSISPSKIQVKNATPKSTSELGISSKFGNTKTSRHSGVKSGVINKTKTSKVNVKNTPVAMKGSTKKLNPQLAQCMKCVVLLDRNQVSHYLNQQKSKKRKQTAKKTKPVQHNKNDTRKKLPPKHLMSRKMKRGSGLKK